METREDLENAGVVMVFREAWMEQVPQTEFTADESQGDLRRLGERLVARYMDEVAPTVEPAAVELDVQGEISGVAVRGRVDVLDVAGRLIDFKTASRRPSCSLICGLFRLQMAKPRVFLVFFGQGILKTESISSFHILWG